MRHRLAVVATAVLVILALAAIVLSGVLTSSLRHQVVAPLRGGVVGGPWRHVALCLVLGLFGLVGAGVAAGAMMTTGAAGMLAELKKWTGPLKTMRQPTAT